MNWKQLKKILNASSRRNKGRQYSEANNKNDQRSEQESSGEYDAKVFQKEKAKAPHQELTKAPKAANLIKLRFNCFHRDTVKLKIWPKTIINQTRESIP